MGFLIDAVAALSLRSSDQRDGAITINQIDYLAEIILSAQPRRCLGLWASSIVVGGVDSQV
jgi:hypothetical protein